MLENTCRILVGKFKARDHLEGQSVRWDFDIKVCLEQDGRAGHGLM